MDKFESRLERIEARLDQMDSRLQSVETVLRFGRRETPPPPPVVVQPVAPPPPPPVLVAQGQPIPPTGAWVRPPSTPTPAPTPPTPVAAAKANPGFEYNIGAKLVPKAGGVLLVGGIGYLVSIGVTSGFITPWMLFLAVVALCLGFIGVGQWRREEKEEFGQILTGVGSCGLYLDFAAGHVFQKLYSGEVLVALFLALSFANLGYSLWRSSRSFLAIGIIGGLIATLMPLQQDKAALSCALHFLILIPAALIAAKNKWIDVTMWLYGAGMIGSGFLFGHGDAWWPYAVGAFGGTAVVCVGAYAWSYRKLEWDPQGAFGPTALFAAAVLSFCCKGGVRGSYHEIALGAAIGLMSFIPMPKSVRATIQAMAFGIPMVIAPFGPELLPSAFIFVFLSIGAAIVASKMRSKFVAGLALLELGLAAIPYFGLVDAHLLTVAMECGFLACGIAALVLSFYALNRAHLNTERHVVITAVLIVPLFARLVQVALGIKYLGAPPLLGVASAFLVYGALMVALTAATKYRSTNTLQWAIIALGVVSYGLQLIMGAPGFGVDSGLALTFASLIVAAGVVSDFRENTSENRLSVVVAGLAIGTLLVRIGYLVLTLPFAAFPASAGCALAAITVCILAMGLARKWKPDAITWVSASFLGAATLFYSGVMSDIAVHKPLELLCIGSLTLAWVALAPLVAKETGGTGESRLYVGIFGLSVGTLLVRISYLVLALPFAAFPADAGCSLGAALVCIVGALLARRWQRNPITWVSTAFLILGTAFYMGVMTNAAIHKPLELLCLGSLMLSLLALAPLVIGELGENDQAFGYYAISGAAWFYLSRLGILMLIGSPVGMNLNPAVTVAWTLTAVILLTIGFLIDVPHMRLAGIGVMAFTVGKIVFVDLADTNPAIKVLLLMLLGGAMIGIGYWYIRTRKGAEEESDSGTPLPSGEEGQG